MDIFWNKIIEKFREKRSRQLVPLARFLLKVHLTANRITLLSLIFGLCSVYFLFNDYFLYLVFGLLHLIGDGLDGVVARFKGVSKYGNYFDFASDRIIAALYLLKIGLYLQDYYVFLALALSIITHSITLATKFRYQSVYSRTIIFVGLVLTPIFPVLNLPVVTYLAAGAISLYSLALQFKFWLETRR